MSPHSFSRGCDPEWAGDAPVSLQSVSSDSVQPGKVQMQGDQHPMSGGA